MSTNIIKHNPQNIENIRGLCYALLLFIGHSVHAQSTVVFCNKSAYTIDSIVVKGRDKEVIRMIASDSCLSFDYPTEWNETHSAIIFSYKGSYNNNFFNGQVLKGSSNDTIWIDDASVLRILPKRTTVFSVILEAASQKIDLINLKVKSSALIAVDTWPDSMGKVLTFNISSLRKKPNVQVRLNGKRYKINFLKEDFSEEYSSQIFFYIDEDSIQRQN